MYLTQNILNLPKYLHIDKLWSEVFSTCSIMIQISEVPGFNFPKFLAHGFGRSNSPHARPPRDDATDSRWLWISDSKDPYIPQGRTWLCHGPDSTDVQINSAQNCTTIFYISRSCKNLTTKNPSTQDHASDTPNHGPLVQTQRQKFQN